MSIIDAASNKGITLTHNSGTWVAEFGTELLLKTTMLSSMERFLNECELVDAGDVLCLRISGFIHHKRRK